MMKAILLDVDGTLYHQGPVRRRMALRLAALPITGWSLRGARDTWRVLRAFRRVVEDLRWRGHAAESLERLHRTETARRTGIAPEAVGRIVTTWMEELPLPHLARCQRRGVGDLARRLVERGWRVGVLSDYPAGRKLAALGLADVVDPCLHGLAPAINALKPHPRGFLHACELWELAPAQVLYVGDRPDVDAAGAAAAGMPCAIIDGSSRPARRVEEDSWRVADAATLEALIDELQ